MAEYPALPLWTDAYLGDTTHLTTIEHGAYLLLLMAMWRGDGSLPDDDRMLARYTKLTGGQWARIAPTIRPFFKSENGRLSQGRLTDELNHVRQHSHRQSNRSKARWLKTKETGDAVGMPDECRGNAPTPTPITRKKEDIPPPSDPDPAKADHHGQKTDRELMLEAMGVDPVSGMTGHGGTRIGTQADMAEAARWLDLPGMTVPLVLEEIRRVMTQKRDGPPKGFKYFTAAMQKLSGSLTQAPLNPIAPPAGARPNDRIARDKTFAELADRLDKGTAVIDHRSRDPLAQLARRDAAAGALDPLDARLLQARSIAN